MTIHQQTRSVCCLLLPPGTKEKVALETYRKVAFGTVAGNRFRNTSTPVKRTETCPSWVHAEGPPRRRSLSSSSIIHRSLHCRVTKRMQEMLVSFAPCWHSPQYSSFGYRSPCLPKHAHRARTGSSLVCLLERVFMRNPSLSINLARPVTFRKKKEKNVLFRKFMIWQQPKFVVTFHPLQNLVAFFFLHPRLMFLPHSCLILG